MHITSWRYMVGMGSIKSLMMVYGTSYVNINSTLDSYEFQKVTSDSDHIAIASYLFMFTPNIARFELAVHGYVILLVASYLDKLSCND